MSAAFLAAGSAHAVFTGGGGDDFELDPTEVFLPANGARGAATNARLFAGDVLESMSVDGAERLRIEGDDNPLGGNFLGTPIEGLVANTTHTVEVFDFSGEIQTITFETGAEDDDTPPQIDGELAVEQTLLGQDRVTITVVLPRLFDDFGMARVALVSTVDSGGEDVRAVLDEITVGEININGAEGQRLKHTGASIGDDVEIEIIAVDASGNETVELVSVVAGGCGCSAANVNASSAPLVVAMVVVFAIRRRRR